MRRLLCMSLLVLLLASSVSADDLQSLARDFWIWRAAHQPLSGDDIPRLDRPAGWLPDWSAETVATRRQALVSFEKRWQQLDATTWPVAQQVDYRLIGSAIARVRWELEVTQFWRRNPLFYIDQTLGSIFDALLLPPPFDAARSADIVRRIERIPRTVAEAQANLTDARAPFARLAFTGLADVREKLGTVSRELKPHLATESAGHLAAAAEKAIAALESFRAWLEKNLANMKGETAVGRDNYVFFLKHVALIPYMPERLVEMGRQEWERAVAFEAYEKNRNQGLPELDLPPDTTAQIANMERAMVEVRHALNEKGIQTIPAWVKFYRLRAKPAYLKPLEDLGVNNDFTGPARLGEDGVAWINPPSPRAGYFDKAYAMDPRMQISHESHGHYLQLVLSWAHKDWIRRHYYDSGPNEGLAFYNEELMLQAGFFDDRPRLREIIYSFMRLRALRVEVDVKLATGEFTIPQAAAYLRDVVPMDAETAGWEAAFFASSPGQAITYQIGKLQILRLLADARLKQGDEFRLRAVHDFLWENGNVPLSLQRWELLGLRDDLDALDMLR